MSVPHDRIKPSVWPVPAQLTAAFLLGIGATLLSVRLIADPVRPMEFRSSSLDLNQADRSQLLQLPGVGPSLADRIVAVRGQSGGFQNPALLQEVPGLGPARFERIRPLLKGDAPSIISPASSSVAPVDINSGTLAELQNLPGIGPKLAQRIIDERVKSPFTSVDDLRRVSGIGPKTLEKLRPFVKVK